MNHQVADDGHKDRLKESELVPDPSPWLDGKTLNVTIPSVYPADAIVLSYEYNEEYRRLQSLLLSLILLVQDILEGMLLLGTIFSWLMDKVSEILMKLIVHLDLILHSITSMRTV